MGDHPTVTPTELEILRDALRRVGHRGYRAEVVTTAEGTSIIITVYGQEDDAQAEHLLIDGVRSQVRTVLASWGEPTGHERTAVLRYLRRLRDHHCHPEEKRSQVVRALRIVLTKAIDEIGEELHLEGDDG